VNPPGPKVKIKLLDLLDKTLLERITDLCAVLTSGFGIQALALTFPQILNDMGIDQLLFLSLSTLFEALQTATSLCMTSRIASSPSLMVAVGRCSTKAGAA
jgi:hypothetical protein